MVKHQGAPTVERAVDLGWDERAIQIGVGPGCSRATSSCAWQFVCPGVAAALFWSVARGREPLGAGGAVDRVAVASSLSQKDAGSYGAPGI